MFYARVRRINPQEIKHIHLLEIWAPVHTRTHRFLFSVLSLCSLLQEIWSRSDAFSSNMMNSFDFHEAVHQWLFSWHKTMKRIMKQTEHPKKFLMNFLFRNNIVITNRNYVPNLYSQLSALVVVHEAGEINTHFWNLQEPLGKFHCWLFTETVCFTCVLIFRRQTFSIWHRL